MRTMRRLPPCGRIIAFALVLVLLTVRIGSLSQETFVYPIQDHIFKTAHIIEENAKHKPPSLKPKRSADLFFGDSEITVEFLPVERELVPFSPFQSLAEVYLDIFIPPDILA